MRIWIITPFEPIPTDGDVRLMRAGMLCETLAERSHQVTWWTPDFEHYTKVHRHGRDCTVNIDDGYQVRLLKSLGYQSHVSIRRLIHNHLLARRFRKASRSEDQRPDVIVCAWPTPDFCKIAVDFGRKQNIPVLVDIRDLWPDLWLDAFPKQLRPIVRLALTPYVRIAKKSLHNAAALIGITEEYLQWALRYANRKQVPNDRVLPIGYKRVKLDDSRRNSAFESLAKKGFEPSDRLGSVFAGNFGRTSDLKSLIEAARILDRVAAGRIRIVLCGSGEQWNSIKALARGVDSALVLDRLTQSELLALFESAKIGLAPFEDIENYQKNIPNKINEYLAMRLAIISPVSGRIRSLINNRKLGGTYTPGDPASLAEVLVAFADDPERLQACRKNADQTFSETADASKIYSDYADLLERVAHTH